MGAAARGEGVKIPVYMDNNATTPVDPAVFDAMRPYFTDICGNPANQHHRAGSEAFRAVETARAQVATAVGAEPRAVVFTSGATESNNLAILGVCQRFTTGHIVTSAIEHRAVLEPCRYLESRGWEVTFLQPDRYGSISSQAVDAAITTNTVMVSIMAANNEVGTLQPVREIGDVCNRRGVVFHCDAAQSLGRMAIDAEAWNVDLLSLSAHKAYGPKGVGALVLRERSPSSTPKPLHYGGGQEAGLRPGTLPVPSIVGFGAAAELAAHNVAEESLRLVALRESLLNQLIRYCPSLVIHGHPTNILPGLLSVGFPNINGDELLFALRDLAVSQGAACAAGSPEPSHVLSAIGVSYDLARASIRFGLGRFSTEEEVQFAALEIARVLALLQ